MRYYHVWFSVSSAGSESGPQQGKWLHAYNPSTLEAEADGL